MAEHPIFMYVEDSNSEGSVVGLLPDAAGKDLTPNKESTAAIFVAAELTDPDKKGKVGSTTKDEDEVVGYLRY